MRAKTRHARWAAIAFVGSMTGIEACAETSAPAKDASNPSSSASARAAAPPAAPSSASSNETLLAGFALRLSCVVESGDDVARLSCPVSPEHVTLVRAGMRASFRVSERPDVIYEASVERAEEARVVVAVPNMDRRLHVGQSAAMSIDLAKPLAPPSPSR